MKGSTIIIIGVIVLFIVFVIITLSQGQSTPERVLRLFWDDPDNVPDSLAYYQVDRWGGSDTTAANYTLLHNILVHKGSINYIDSIRVDDLFFRYRVRAVHRDLVSMSDWGYTRFYKYTEFFPLNVRDPRIRK
jgi:hypothetical protein